MNVNAPSRDMYGDFVQTMPAPRLMARRLTMDQREMLGVGKLGHRGDGPLGRLATTADGVLRRLAPFAVEEVLT